MTKEKVLEWLPEINLLKNEEMREKCIACWIEALETNGWENVPIEKHPLAVPLVAEDCPENNIDHCRRVIQMCKVAYDNLGEYANDIGTLDEDILLAAAIVHDVGKYYEYGFKDGKAYEIEPFGKMFRHPIVGAYLAKKHGLPDKVVHAVMAHSDRYSPEGPNAYMTPESMLVKRMDFTCFQIAQLQYPPNK